MLVVQPKWFIFMDKKQLLRCILENTSDIELMDEINSLTFPYTTKYRQWKKKQIKEDDGKIDIGLWK